MKIRLPIVGSLMLCMGSYGCTSTPTKPPAQTEFDLSILGTKNIDEVQNMLGTPATDTAPDPFSGQTSSAKVWKKPNACLITEYDSSTRRVHFFYMSVGTSDRYSGGKFGGDDGTSEADLWTMAHLSPGSAVGIARVIPVKGEPGHFYGLKLTPPH